jgi:hypothetical protein
MTFNPNIKRWLENILYKRAVKSWTEIKDNQIKKGSEKYRDPLPGDWTAKQLIRHAKEENVDQFIYLEALEMKVEALEAELADQKRARVEADNRAKKAEKDRQDILVMMDRERRKWANMGR